MKLGQTSWRVWLTLASVLPDSPEKRFAVWALANAIHDVEMLGEVETFGKKWLSPPLKELCNALYIDPEYLEAYVLRMVKTKEPSHA